MLAPNEFFVGRLQDAKPMSIVMPASKYQPSFLVVGIEDDGLLAVVLDGQHAFKSFDCTKNNSYQGMVVHPVAIEVDETSIFDPGRFDAPMGSLTRKDDALNIVAQPDAGFRVGERCKLVGGLPIGYANSEVGFTKWCVVTGTGEHKRTLLTIDRPKPKDD